MTQPPEFGPISAREFDQLSLRVSETAARLTKLEDERIGNAVLGEKLDTIRTDFGAHEREHANASAALRADIRALLVKVAAAAITAAATGIVALLHSYVKF